MTTETPACIVSKPGGSELRMRRVRVERNEKRQVRDVVLAMYREQKCEPNFLYAGEKNQLETNSQLFRKPRRTTTRTRHPPRCLPTRRSVRKLARASESAKSANAMLTRARPSPASPTTSSSLTFSDMSISTIPPISHGSQRSAVRCATRWRRRG